MQTHFHQFLIVNKLRSMFMYEGTECKSVFEAKHTHTHTLTEVWWGVCVCVRRGRLKMRCKTCRHLARYAVPTK